MRWRRFKKIIKEYPYLIDDSFKMSMSDAQKIIDEGNPMSFEEMIRSAMKKSSVPGEVWLKSVPALRRKKSNPKRRLAIVLSSVTAAVIFFTVVPAGQVLAKTAIDTIVSFFENEIVVSNDNRTDNVDITDYEKATALPLEHRNANVGETLNTNSEEDTLEYDSVAAFFKDTGKDPVIISDDDIILSSVYFMEDNNMLLQKYYSDEYGEIYVTQHWLSDNELVSIGKQKYYDHRPVLDGEYDAYYGVYEADNTYEGMIVMDDSYVLVGLRNISGAGEILDKLSLY